MRKKVANDIIFAMKLFVTVITNKFSMMLQMFDKHITPVQLNK